MWDRSVDVSDQRALAIVGQAVRIARHRSALSQRGLAARSGVSQSAISRMERGSVRGMGLVYLARVVEALGDSISLVGCPHGHDCEYARVWASARRQVAFDLAEAAGSSLEGPTLFELLRRAERAGEIDVPA